MAKISYNSNQANPGTVAILGSLGLFVCLIFSVLGIKLWWFKRRLEFDQTTTQNGAAGGSPPQVVVPRREKKGKFSKDKRWSQQVYHNVEVHGVFKPKKEEDTLIQRPAQLPPVRIRPSGSAPSLILPPPRQKRRSQLVQSTASEEITGSLGSIAVASTTPSSPTLSQEIFSNLNGMPGTPITNLNPATSSAPPNLPLPSKVAEKSPEISLTFKEVEKDLKIPALPVDIVTPLRQQQTAPIPPKRLNRSSSHATAQQVQEKPHRFLKSSQSVSVPEFRKVIERRPTGFHRPEEIDDLTKIDDLDEPKFELFGDRRPTGYIKYEEVDVVDMDLGDYRFERAYLKSGASAYADPIDALRDEEIVYQNPTSPDICEINEAIESYEKSQKWNGGGGVEGEVGGGFKRQDFSDFHKSYGHRDASSRGEDYEKREFFEETRNGKETQKPIVPNMTVELRDQTIPQDFESYLPRQETDEEFKSHEKSLSSSPPPPSNDVLDGESKESSSFAGHTYCESFEEPQCFEEKPLSFEINQTKVQFSAPEALENGEEKFTLNQRRPTEFVRFEMEDEEEEELEEKPTQPSKAKYSSLKAFLMSEKQRESESDESQSDYYQDQISGEESKAKDHGVRFNTSHFSESDGEEKFTLNQRRPTAFQREVLPVEPESSVRFAVAEKESDEEKFTLNQRRPTSFQREAFLEESESSVRFAVAEKESDEEKFTLNQRRPTAFQREILPQEHEESRQGQTARFNSSETESDEEKFTLNQRRPTAYQREESFERQTVRFNSSTLGEDDNEEKFTLNQRRPTAYVREKDDEKVSQQQSRVHFENLSTPESNEEKFTLNQRRPTEFVGNNNAERVRFDDSITLPETNEEKFTLNQRRPTAYVLSMEKESEENGKTVIFATSEEESESEMRPTNGKKVSQTANMVRFENSSAYSESDEEKFSLNKRRPTGYAPKNGNENHTVIRFANESQDEEEEKFTLNQRRPTAFPLEESATAPAKVTFNLLQDFDPFEMIEEKFTLNQRRPTAFNNPPQDFEEQVTSFMTQEDEDDDVFEQNTNSNNLKFSTSMKLHENHQDIIWQELEKDIEKDFAQNIEEEFARIRQSLELNEGDFLELKEDLQLMNSPIAETPIKLLNSFENGNGFGKSIDEDWENFEKLNTPSTPGDIQIIYDKQMSGSGSSSTTVSILKESKEKTNGDSPPTAKPRKSKVTFDFKTEEHYIPARRSVSDEDDSDVDNEYYDKTPPPIASQRFHYEEETLFEPIVVTTPKTISLFGSLSQEDEAGQMEDSWSAIRKHRHMTAQFQGLTLESTSSSPPPPSYPPPPPPNISTQEDDEVEIHTPKPAYRNPMALLAAQRAKEARQDLGEFKGRSIKNAQKRTSQEFVNLQNDFDDTEA
ncbi:uncharacterized protein [Musca autumnalis]|uniref:uncharacterized protein n=1 Tax=Musca autumnalis TaxID=221902 RepID=UPI003CF25F73